MTMLALPCASPCAKRQRLTWTDEENRIIVSTVRRVGTQWDLVAAQLPGRTADAVRNQCHRLQKNSTCASALDLGADEGYDSDGSSEDQRKTGSAHGRSVWYAAARHFTDVRPLSPPCPEAASRAQVD